MALSASAPLAFARQAPQTQALQHRSHELRRDLMLVSERVYTALGYSPANISITVSDTGLISVDTGMVPARAAQALADFRQISDLPVAAICCTHGRGDHTGGAAVLAAGSDPQV